MPALLFTSPTNRIQSARSLIVFFVFAWLAIWPVAVSAQLPLARLFTLFPPGGKIGTTFEVSVSGTDLDEANQLHFSNTNITAKPKMGDGGQSVANTFIVSIASNAAPVVCEVRIAGRFGISNPRAFAAGDLPEMIEPSTNKTAEAASEVPLGTLVNGRAEANALDYFKFSAKKGQRVLAQCAAAEMDSHMDAVLVLSDAAGHELERNRRGGLLDFTAPSDGQFILKVHDLLYRGGPEYFYRLAVGVGPYLDFIFPPSGLPGTTNKYVVYGRNLPGGTSVKAFSIDGKSLEQVTVEIALPDDAMTRQRLSASALDKPAGAAVDGIEYRLSTPQGVSNPMLLSFAAAPVVVEQNPNDKPEAAQKISVPCEFTGQFYPAGDVDWVTFDAKKGEVYWVEIFSQRLGLPTDPFMLVQQVKKNEKGEAQATDLQELYDTDANIGGAEFKTTSLDPAWRLEVKEDSAYRIQVRDLFNRSQSDPRSVYRLSIRKESPDFRLVALPHSPASAKKDSKEVQLWTPLLRRGETIPLKILAFRRDGFGGDIALTVEGLPAGVTACEAKIPAGANAGVVLLTATPEAASWSGVVKVIGKAKAGDVELLREARGGSIIWNVADNSTEAISSRLARNVALGVSGNESAPVSVEVGERKVLEIAGVGKVQLPIKITRRGEFDGALKLKAFGLSALDSLPELDVAAKATNATLEIDLSKQKIPAGLHSFYLQTQVQGKYRNNPEGAKAAEEAVKEAEKSASASTADAKKAAEALAAAVKAASDADAAAKKAAEKFASAKTAAEQTSATAEVVAAKSAAEKDAADAAAKLKAAAEAKVAAEKSVAETSAKAKEAEARKLAAASRAKELAERAKPKDVTITVYSTPIQVKMAAAPVAAPADKKDAKK